MSELTPDQINTEAKRLSETMAGIPKAHWQWFAKLHLEEKEKLNRSILESEAANAVMREALADAKNVLPTGYLANTLGFPSRSHINIHDIIDNALSTTAGKSILEERDRLRSALNKCYCAIQGYKDTNPLHEDSVLNLARIAAKQALEIPQPTETKEKE